MKNYFLDMHIQSPDIVISMEDSKKGLAFLPESGYSLQIVFKVFTTKEDIGYVVIDIKDTYEDEPTFSEVMLRKDRNVIMSFIRERWQHILALVQTQLQDVNRPVLPHFELNYTER